jgi:hypothetical protein
MWRVITGAPVLTSTMALILIGLTWGLMDWLYGDELDNKNAKIRLLQKEIAEMEDQLAYLLRKQAY